jgi:hypothetical protein
MPGINRDDGLIDLEIAFPNVEKAFPVGPNVGTAIRPREGGFRVKVPLAVVPVKN